MKRQLRQYLLLLTITLVVGACRPDKIEGPEGPVELPSLEELLRQVPLKIVTDTTFVLRNITSDQELTTNNDMKIYLRQTERLFVNAQTRAPEPCSKCNELKVKVSEVYKTGDVVGRNVPTATSANLLLETGTMTHIQATCDGRTLAIADNYTIQLKVPSPNQISDFTIHHYEPDATPRSGWAGTNSPAIWASWNSVLFPGERKTGYDLLVRKMNWIAPARLIAASNNTFLKVQVGNGNVINQNNTRVFVTFKDNSRTIRGIAQFYVKEGDAPNMFTFDGAPIGTTARVYIISKIGEQFLWKEDDIRQRIQREMSIVSMTPDNIGPTELLEALRAL